MQITDVFSSNSIALNRTEVISNTIPYLGLGFFPNKKKMGLDLNWLITHKGLNVALKTANFDAIPTVRSREKFDVAKTQMAFFRESMIVKEEDMMELERIKEKSDPYLKAVMNNIYDDANKLLDGAEIVAEIMRMQLLATDAGTPKIVLESDNAKYEYDYDPSKEYKKEHYLKLTSTDTWDNPTTAKPLNDFKKAKQKLSSLGVTATYALMNSETFDYLVENSQIKSAILAQNATANIFLDDELLKEFLERKTKMKFILYDKMYVDYNGKQQYFYPKDKVTIIGDSALGNTWRGTTPEERTLLGRPNSNVSVMNDGVAITVKTEEGPPVMVTTSVSQIILPSYEGMNSTFVIDVK